MGDLFLDKHCRISPKAKDVKCYAAAGIVQELARPKSEPDSEVVRANRNPKHRVPPILSCVSMYRPTTQPLMLLDIGLSHSFRLRGSTSFSHLVGSIKFTD